MYTFDHHRRGAGESQGDRGGNEKPASTQASVLQVIAFILAAMSDPFVSGRIAMKGVTP